MNHHHPELGKFPTATDTKDAIHFPVIPLTTAVKVSPGEHVTLRSDGRVAPGPNPIGIIDPF